MFVWMYKLSTQWNTCKTSWDAWGKYCSICQYASIFVNVSIVWNIWKNRASADNSLLIVLSQYFYSGHYHGISRGLFRPGCSVKKTTHQSCGCNLVLVYRLQAPTQVSHSFLSRQSIQHVHPCHGVVRGGTKQCHHCFGFLAAVFKCVLSSPSVRPCLRCWVSGVAVNFPPCQ